MVATLSAWVTSAWTSITRLGCDRPVLITVLSVRAQTRHARHAAILAPGPRRYAQHIHGRACPRAGGVSIQWGSFWGGAPMHGPASAAGTVVPGPSNRGQWPSVTRQ